MVDREVEPRFKNAKPFRKRKKRRDLSAWRESVLRRDGGRCCLCHYRGPHLSAHHVIFLSHCAEQYEDDRRNGLTLCNGFANGCHEAVHAGKKKLGQNVLPTEVQVCLAEQGLRWVNCEPTGTLARYFE